MQCMGGSVSQNGNFYTSWLYDDSQESFKTRAWRLYKVEYVRGKFTNPMRLEIEGAHPLIAPDESWIIFDSKQHGGFGNGDYFIVFKNRDGTWSEPVNMGEKINCKNQNARTRLSNDGKYLFFSRHGDIYWISIKIIEELRQKDIK